MMKILINHCFDWESFHFIDTFLSLSYQVFGLNDKKVKMSEHIAMYFARNSLFSQKDTILHEKAFDIAIVFDDISLLQQISAKKKFLKIGRASCRKRVHMRYAADIVIED